MTDPGDYQARAKRLAAISATAARLAREAAKLRTQMRAAAEAEDPTADIAEAADMHRSSVYRWLSDQPPTRRKP